MNCPHCGKEIPVDLVDPKAVEAAQEKLLQQRKMAQVGTGKSEGFKRLSTGFSTGNVRKLAKSAENGRTRTETGQPVTTTASDGTLS